MGFQKMFFVAWVCWGFVMINVQAAGTTNQTSGQVFQFKFDPNKPLVYAIQYKTSKLTDTTTGSRDAMVKNNTTLNLKMRLTAINTNQDGTTTVLYEPFDFVQQVEVNNTSGKMEILTRGLNITAKQNEITVVDTANNIGTADGKTMKQAVYGMLLSGYFDLDAAGNIKKISGDLPFVDTWQENLKNQIGLFQIIFPTNSISVRDAWTNNVVIKNSNGVVFDGDGLVQPYVFSRELDATETGSSLANFSLYESQNLTDLTGYVERNGERTALVIPEHVNSVNATFHFDQTHNCLVDIKKHEQFDETMNMVSQGNSTTSRSTIESDWTIQLVTP